MPRRAADDRGMKLRLPLAFAGALLVAAPAADAASVVYIENDNVVAASPDGAKKRVLTTDGRPDSTYRSPSADDTGRWIAAREQTWYWHDAAGKLLSADLVDKGKCESLSTGPVAGRLDPTGDFVAFESMCSGFAGQGITTRVVINFPGRPTLGNAPVLDGWRQPTWMGNRLVADGGNGTFVQEPDNAPASTSFTAWSTGTARAELSRDRRRGLVTVKPQEGNPEELWMVRTDADPPLGTPKSACKVPIVGAATRAGFSPDGTTIVWRDDRGIVTAPAPEPPPSGTEQVGPCAETAAPTVLSATGTEPSFTAFDLHAAGDAVPAGPAGPISQPGGPGPEAQGGPTQQTRRLTLTPARKMTLGSFGRGAKVSVDVPAPGTGRVVATVPKALAKRLGLGRGRALASARFTARTAGTLTVKLKVPAARARRLRKLGRVPVTFTATFADQTATAARTLRR